MCGKGSQSTTSNTSQTYTPNPQASSLYQNILQQAQGVAATPYQPYGGELVAPVNAQQSSGIANINATQPNYNSALGMMYNASQPINANQISQYESPYTQQVVNATQAQFNNQNAQQQQQVLGGAAAQGALGGNRVGIAQSELANQQQLAQAPVIANLENQGYMTGLNTALTEQQAGQQGAYGVANLANAALTGANAQVGAGSLQQQTQQAQDTANYQQYLNALSYPFQTTQWLAGIGTGVGSQLGGTTTGTGTTTGPSPSLLSQLIGGGSAGLGLLGSTGAFGNSGYLTGSSGLLPQIGSGLSSFGASLAGMGPFLDFASHGGGINGYEQGGGVVPQRQTGGAISNYQLFGGGYGQPVMPYSGGKSFIPTIGVVQGHGAPATSGQAPPNPYQFENELGLNQQQQKNQQGLTGLLKGFSGRDSSSGNSSPTATALDGSGAETGGVPLAGLTPPGNSDDTSSFDEEGMEDLNWGQKSGGRVVGIARHADGGNVEPMPMSLEDIPDTLRRLSAAGISNDSQAKDFTSARLKRLGINPKPYTGQDAPYARGGIAHLDAGGDPDAGGDAPYQEASLEAGDTGVGANGVAGGAPMVTDLNQHVLKDVPLPTPRPQIEPATGVAAAVPSTGDNVPLPRSVPRGLRNNNPGNIEDGPFAQAQPGYKGSDGRFAIFNTPDQGQAATNNLLASYGSKGLNTVSGIINRWAPAADNNNTNAYIAAVSKATGYAPNAPLDMSDPAVRNKLANAIHSYENGMPAGYLNTLATRDYDRGYGGLDSQERLPPNATLDQGVVPPQYNQQSDRWGADNPLWGTLLATGAGMLASRSPFAGVAVGEGLQQGLGYATQQEQIREAQHLGQARIDNEATRLQNEADHWQKDYEVRQQQLRETSRIKELELGNKVQPIVGSDGQIHYIARGANGQWQDLGGAPPQGGAAAPSAAPSNAQPTDVPGAQPSLQSAVYHPDAKDGLYRSASKWADQGPYNYANGGDLGTIEKGAPIPEPASSGGYSSDAIKNAGEYYFETGKMPGGITMRTGSSPVALQQNQYVHAIVNYASALAASRGLTPEQVADMQRSASGMLKFIAGADGRATVSLGTAVRHLDTLKQYADAWEQGDKGIQTLNSMRAAISREFGSDAATNVETVSSIVGPEILKAIGIAGAGGQEDRDRVLNLFSTAKTAPQLMNAIVATQKLMGGQLEGKERQAAALGVNHDKFVGLIGDRPYEILKNIDKSGGGAQPGAPPGTAQPMAQPAPVFDKATVQQWLQNNPNDPRAPAVRQRLQTMP